MRRREERQVEKVEENTCLREAGLKVRRRVRRPSVSVSGQWTALCEGK